MLTSAGLSHFKELFGTHYTAQQVQDFVDQYSLPISSVEELCSHPNTLLWAVAGWLYLRGENKITATPYRLTEVEI